MKFVKDDGEFAIEDYRHAVRIVFTAQEIIVDNASYPTPRIGENSRDYRPIGLGYANLGALLMNRGLAYDSDAGRSYSAAVTALMQAEAALQSARISRDQGGPFAGYAINREPYLKVMGMHREAAYRIDERQVPEDLLDATLTAWDEVVALGEKTGFRNGQLSVLAPTGTIAFMMDCDTTGVEPDIALIKYKRLVGGGYLKIVNHTVQQALKRLGYSATQVEEIVSYIDEHETIEGAPHLRDEHLDVFDCAFKPANGTRSIHYNGHLKMMAAVQPFIVRRHLQDGEHAGGVDRGGDRPGLHRRLEAGAQGHRGLPGQLQAQPAPEHQEGRRRRCQDRCGCPSVQTIYKPVRRRLPDERSAFTHKFNVAGHEGYLTVGLYDDGQPGELFIRISKEGSTVAGMMEAFAIAVSVALQYGVPLKDLVNKFSHMRFEPAGFTSNQDVPMAKSIVDYIFRYLASKFLSRDEQDVVGVINRQMSLAEAQPVTGEASEEGPTASGFATSAAGTSSDAATSDVSGPGRGDETVDEAAAAAIPVEAPAGADAGEVGEEAHENGLLDGLKIVAQARDERLSVGQPTVIFDTADSPSCSECGSIMVSNGSCYKCINCGATSGCS